MGDRRYPDRPIVGVGAVVLDQERRVLLVKRALAPSAGKWSVPGGALELGERLTEACAREVQEECGLEVEVGPQLLTYDMIDRDEAGKVRYHFLLIDFLATVRGGDLRPNSEVLEARWVTRDDLPTFDLTRSALLAIEEAYRLAEEAGERPPGEERRRSALFRTNETALR